MESPNTKRGPCAVHSLLISVSLLIAVSGCMSSPEVKWADDSLAEQRYDEARAMYNRALSSGLHTETDRQKVKEKLASIDEELNKRKQAEFDANAREERKKTPPDERLVLLVNQAQDESLSQSLKDEALGLLKKEAPVNAQKNITPDSLFVFELAHELILKTDKTAARNLLQSMGSGVLRAFKTNRNDEKIGGEWLKITSAMPKWKSYPNAGAIEAERSLLAQAVIKKRIPAAATDKTACDTWFNTTWDEPSVRSTIQKRCEQAAAKTLQQIISQANPNKPMTTRLALDKLATKLSLTSAQVTQGQNLLNQLALPWRQIAQSMTNEQTRAFFLSLADSVDGKTSISSTRAKLVNEAKSYKFPAVKIRNTSSKNCNEDGKMIVRRAKFEKGSDSGGVVDVELNITSCSSNFNISWARVRVQQRSNRVCKEYQTTKKKVVQESRPGKRYDAATGRSQTYYYQVAVTKYTPVKSTHCTGENQSSLITDRATICTRVDLQGSGKISVDGKVVHTFKAPTMQDNICSTELVTYPSDQSRPSFEGPSHEQRQGRVEHFKKVLLTPLQNQASREQRTAYLKRLAPLKNKIARLKKSAEINHRIAAGVLVGQLNMAKSGSATLKIADKLESIAPERGMLKPLREGKSAKWNTYNFDSKHVLSQKKWRRTFKPNYLATLEKIDQKSTDAKSRITSKLRQKKKGLWRALPQTMMWHSTGPLVNTARGPAADWPVKHPTAIALQVDFQAGQHITKQGSYLDTQWLGSIAVGALHLSGGTRLGLGDTKGYNLAARWMPGSSSPHDPDLSWSVGLLFDVLKPNDNIEASTLRLPIEFNLPILNFLSLNLALEPDLFQLADLTSINKLEAHETGLSASKVLVGGTLTLWRGRIIMHGGAGSALSNDGISWGIWRAQAGFRF